MDYRTFSELLFCHDLKFIFIEILNDFYSLEGQKSYQHEIVINLKIIILSH
jgi:hypothetical protein